jgi:hypothetical protein
MEEAEEVGEWEEQGRRKETALVADSAACIEIEAEQTKSKNRKK